MSIYAKSFEFTSDIKGNKKDVKYISSIRNQQEI